MLTEEQLLIQQTAAAFAAEQLFPSSSEWDKNSTFPSTAIKKLGELGFMGMLVPTKYGGSGVDCICYVLAMMAIASGDASCSTIVGVNNSVVCGSILAFGTEAQKDKWLLPLARGKALGAFCLTEPEAGSDAAAIKTTAYKQNNQYILNGTKQFITSGKHADYAIVFASTQLELGKKGLSAFIVPTDTPGYHVLRLEEKLGQKASDTAQIGFENCVIPEENRLGAEGEGYKIALSQLESGRIGIAAQAVGIAQSALKLASQYSKDRKTFGKLLCEHQAIAFKLAEMATDIEAAKQLTVNAARLKDASEPCTAEVAMAKLFSAQMVERVCSNAIQIFGGYGYLKDFPVEQLYRDARVIQLYEGTNEVQMMLINRFL